MDDIKLAKILVVDDQEYNVSLLERILNRGGFQHVFSSMDSSNIKQLMTEIEPDIVLLDLHMPEIDGVEAIHIIREIAEDDTYLPVIMLTADLTPESKQRALQAGVNDFLTKPFDRTEVILRMNNLLNTRFLHQQLQQQNATLEQRVLQRTLELQNSKREILQLLARVSEYRDDLTGKHTQRVGLLSGLIAERMGLDPSEASTIRLAAPLHDIGKIGIPDEILLKPGKFEPHEFEKMKEHTVIGGSILEDSSFTLLQLAGTIAYSHHEKWNGTGYPKGLKGEEIPLPARIVALADFYDALTHERPYKRAWTPEETLDEILKQRGVHFDPKVVDAFVQLFEEKHLLTSIEVNDEIFTA